MKKFLITFILALGLFISVTADENGNTYGDNYVEVRFWVENVGLMVIYVDPETGDEQGPFLIEPDLD